jgi:RNA polymerase sigma factor (sigma-70 family)
VADVTVLSMHDARDAEDTRLLTAGEYNALVKAYYETIIQRCRARCRSNDDALDCAQAVAVRLLTELKRGKTYAVPFRVVVQKVIEWTTKGFYASYGPAHVELPEELFHAGNPYSDVETRYDLERAIARLPKKDREVAQLRFVQGLEIEEIAMRLRKKRNAVDQSLHRSRQVLQGLLV